MRRLPFSFAVGFSNHVVIVTLLLAICSARFSVAYAGATDPTPSQIVSAIKRAHIEGIAAGDPSLASRFVVYRCCEASPSGDDVYGAHPGDSGDHFDLSHVVYITVNGEHLVLFRYVAGNSVWKDFAFFVGSLNYAGALPVIGPNNKYQTVGPNLVIRLHTLQGSDAMCCPSGPWVTIATFSANSGGLFASTPNPTATRATQIESVGSASPAHPTGAAVSASAATTAQRAAVAALFSLERSRGNTDVERPSCFIVQSYAQCLYEMGHGNADGWVLLYLKNGEWTFLGGGGEVAYDQGVAQFGSFAAMLERQYGVPASVATQFAANILHP